MDEQTTFITFRETHTLIYPLPVKPTRAEFANLDWQFYLDLVTGLSALLLVALRTAGEFYLAAAMVFDNPIFSRAEAILAVLGIEGFMFSSGIGKVKRSGKINRQWRNIAVILSLGISLIAGLAHSLGVIENLSVTVRTWVSGTLTVALTIASFVAYIAGEIVGSHLANIDIEYRAALNLYQKEYADWETKLIARWNNSHERRNARAGITPKLSETFVSDEKLSDWRHVPHADRLQIAEMSTQQIITEYGTSERTATNWKSYAQEYQEQTNGHI